MQPASRGCFTACELCERFLKRGYLSDFYGLTLAPIAQVRDAEVHTCDAGLGRARQAAGSYRGRGGRTCLHILHDVVSGYLVLLSSRTGHPLLALANLVAS